MEKEKDGMGRASSLAVLVSVVCAALAVGAVLVWAQPCTGTVELASGSLMPMRCIYTGKIAVLLGLILLVVGVMSLAMKRPFTIAVFLLSAALVVLAFETPVSIGVCKASGMACESTVRWLVACGSVSAVASLVGFFTNTRRKRVRG